MWTVWEKLVRLAVDVWDVAASESEKAVSVKLYRKGVVCGMRLYKKVKGYVWNETVRSCVWDETV